MYSSQRHHVPVCGAPFPENLTYSADQLKAFKSPAEHERNMADLMENEELERFVYAMKGQKIGKDITLNYVEHFQWLLEYIMHHSLSMVSSGVLDVRFYQLCDIAGIGIVIRPTHLVIQRMEIRPCAQGYGYIRLIICQVLMACWLLKKNLVFSHPVEHTKNILTSLFGTSNYSTFEALKAEVANMLEMPWNKKMREEKFFIMTWDRINFYFAYNGIIDQCRIGPLVDPCKPWIDYVVQINHSAFPTAAQLNDQEYVDAHYDTVLARKEQRSREVLADAPPA